MYSQFLPIISRPVPKKRVLPKLPVVGVQIEGRATSQVKWLARGSLVRYRVQWDTIEKTPNVYEWPIELDQDIQAIRGAGCPIMLNVICTPPFYAIHEGIRCSPPRPDKINKLVKFIQALTARYLPTAIEIWNEPEVSATEAKNAGLDAILGGYGGMPQHYGDVVAQIGTKFIEQRIPTWVVAGSLLCSDSKMLFWRQFKSRCSSGLYDACSFHSYATYPSSYYDDVATKVGWMRKYGERSVIILSEMALVSEVDGEDFRQKQADYFAYQINKMNSWGIKSGVWYALTGNEWKNSDMVKNNEAMPVWYEYQGVYKDD